MGQTLSEPVTNKESAALENSMVKVGSSCMQGWRISMEDAHVHVLNLPDDPDSMFFGVFDGHGGASVARYAAKHLHKIISNRPEYRPGSYSEAIKKGFLECDDKMRTEETLKDEMSGATAITVLLRKKKEIYIGNIGDSRCVASISGTAEPLSTDHKPTDSLEKTRIENAGCFVEYSRVNGNLALSRAFGDFGFKNRSDLRPEQQAVCAFPDVVTRDIDANLDFFILACDGIWDVLKNQEVVDFIARRIAFAMEPEDICEELMNRCLATDSTMGGLGCDNMTCILVILLKDKPYSDLVKKYKILQKKKKEEEEAAAAAVPPPTTTTTSGSESSTEVDCRSIVDPKESGKSADINGENPSDNQEETNVNKCVEITTNETITIQQTDE